MAIDRADWHWESAAKLYREKHNVTGQFTQEQINEIWLLASNHIGLFIKWLIDNDLQGEDANEKACREVRDGIITGSEYLMIYLDGKFWDEDVNSQALEFVEEYYEKDFLNDYCESCPCGESNVPCYSFTSGDDDYNALKKCIDTAYKEYTEKSKH